MLCTQTSKGTEDRCVPCEGCCQADLRHTHSWSHQQQRETSTACRPRSRSATSMRKCWQRAASVQLKDCQVHAPAQAAQLAISAVRPVSRMVSLKVLPSCSDPAVFVPYIPSSLYHLQVTRHAGCPASHLADTCLGRQAPAELGAGQCGAAPYSEQLPGQLLHRFWDPECHQY